MNDFKKSFISSVKPLYKALPIIVGVILLISLVSTLIPKSVYSSVFRGNIFVDSIVAAILGSVFMGNPATSYIIGGEFLNLGISLVAVTSFLIAWVTVGVVQLPAEMLMLGKKFAIVRNLLSFLFSTLSAITIVLLLGILK